MVSLRTGRLHPASGSLIRAQMLTMTSLPFTILLVLQVTLRLKRCGDQERQPHVDHRTTDDIFDIPQLSAMPFRSPPGPVVYIFNIVCTLFKTEWWSPLGQTV